MQELDGDRRGAAGASLRDKLIELNGNGRDVDAIVQVGTNLSMVRLAAAAEMWLGKPVIAINTATYWHALRQNKIMDKILGSRAPAGRLLVVPADRHLRCSTTKSPASATVPVSLRQFPTPDRRRQPRSDAHGRIVGWDSIAAEMQRRTKLRGGRILRHTF